jgi:hypothetical protein
MAKSTNTSKSQRRANRSSQSPADAIQRPRDMKSVSLALARDTAALLRKAADQAEALAAESDRDPLDTLWELHMIMARGVGGRLVDLQDIAGPFALS